MIPSSRQEGWLRWTISAGLSAREMDSGDTASAISARSVTRSVSLYTSRAGETCYVAAIAFSKWRCDVIFQRELDLFITTATKWSEGVLNEVRLAFQSPSLSPSEVTAGINKGYFYHLAKSKRGSLNGR